MWGDAWRSCCTKSIASRSSGWPTCRPGTEQRVQTAHSNRPFKPRMQEAHLGNTPAMAAMAHPEPPATARPLVSLRQVGKRFANGTLALQDMTLDIGEHPFISLLGPSGCGKSTALRLMAGLDRSRGATMHWND